MKIGKESQKQWISEISRVDVLHKDISPIVYFCVYVTLFGISMLYWICYMIMAFTRDLCQLLQTKSLDLLFQNTAQSQ